MTDKTLKVIAGTPDNPLRIGDIELPCYVLEGETRVLVQRGMVSALGMARGSSSGSGGDRLAKFVAGKGLSSFIDNKLLMVTANPLKFRTSRGNIAYGYEATILADICDAVLLARKAGLLQKQQTHIAQQCEELIRGFARVGIIALVDEATGYQDLRDRRALHKILDQYLLPERAKWAKRFPDEFYKEIFRLRKWPWRGMKINRPSVVGHYTNDIVWGRIERYVHEELRKRNPRTESGHRRAKHHQWLTHDLGHNALQSHLIGVMALMRASPNWDYFKRNLARAYPKHGEKMPLPFEED